MGKSILLFCRGQGENHAMRDMILADSIVRSNSDVEIKFASYNDGYRALLAKGRLCINIGPPSKGDEHNRLIKIGQTIRDLAPDLIVSDEELLPLPLAKVLEAPSYLITNWFPPNPNHATRSYFSDPEGIFFPELEGCFAVPSWLKTAVHFVGPILGSTLPFTDDRKKAREEVGVEVETKLILGIAEQGTNSDAKFLKCCIEAFKSLNLDARMILIVGELSDDIEREIETESSISVKEYTRQMDKYMLASNLVLTRGGYFTLWKLAIFGIPSICVPRADGDFKNQNFIHAKNMEGRKTSVVFKEDYLSSENIAEQMRVILASQEKWEEMSHSALKICQQCKGADAAAEIIVSKLTGESSSEDASQR